MNIITSIVFSTLVFSTFAHAATEERTEIRGTVAPTQFSDSIDEYTITPAPSIPDYKAPAPPFIYAADKSLFFRIAQYTFWEESETFHPIGVTFSDYSRNMESLEYGFDIKEDLGRLFFGKKYYFNLTGRFRTYYKIDLGLNLDPDDGLANLVNFKKYMLGVALGSEIQLTTRSGLRVEAALYRSRDDTILQFQGGYVYSW
jgi:hypothetical protein